MGKRIIWLDVAKGIGIILIVLGHCSKGGLYRFCYSFNSMIFFIISGIAFAYADLKYVEAEDFQYYGRFIIKKLRGLMLPYAIWALISIIIFQLLGQLTAGYLGKEIAASTLPQNLLGGLYANSETGYFEWNRPLWFLPCLFIIEIFTYAALIVLKRLLRCLRPAAIAFTGFGFLILIVYFYSSLNLILPFEIETAFNMLGFFGLGICGYLYKEDIITAALWLRIKIPVLARGIWLQQLFLSAIFIALGIWIGAFNIGTDTMTDQFYRLYLYIPIGLCESIGVILLSIMIAGTKYRLFTYIGNRTLAILVMHKFPVLFFQTLCPYTKEWLAKGNVIASLAITAVTLALCLAVERIVSRFIPFVYGRRNNLRHRISKAKAITSM